MIRKLQLQPGRWTRLRGFGWRRVTGGQLSPPTRLLLAGRWPRAPGQSFFAVTWIFPQSRLPVHLPILQRPLLSEPVEQAEGGVRLTELLKRPRYKGGTAGRAAGWGGGAAKFP